MNELYQALFIASLLYCSATGSYQPKSLLLFDDDSPYYGSPNQKVSETRELLEKMASVRYATDDEIKNKDHVPVQVPGSSIFEQKRLPNTKLETADEEIKNRDHVPVQVPGDSIFEQKRLSNVKLETGFEPIKNKENVPVQVHGSSIFEQKRLPSTKLETGDRDVKNNENVPVQESESSIFEQIRLLNTKLETGDGPIKNKENVPVQVPESSIFEQKRLPHTKPDDLIIFDNDNQKGKAIIETEINENTISELGSFTKDTEVVYDATEPYYTTFFRIKLRNFFSAADTVTSVFDTVHKVTNIYTEQRRNVIEQTSNSVDEQSTEIDPNASIIGTLAGIFMQPASLGRMVDLWMTSQSSDQFLEGFTGVLLGSEVLPRSGGHGYGHGGGHGYKTALTLDPVTVIALLSLLAYLIRVAFQVVNGRAMDGRSVDGTVDTLPWQNSDMMVRVLEYISNTDYHSG